jgi:hypothetical protein
MDYKENLKERYELLKKKYIDNAKELKNKFGMGEFKALGGSSVILFIKYRFDDSEKFYEDAIDKLEESILKQINIFEERRVYGWNNNFDTKMLKFAAGLK